MDPAPSTIRTLSRNRDELELTIDSLAYGGAGVARLDGYVVFVADAVPGDRVRAVVEKSKRAYAQARAVEVLEPSPERIPPLAAHPGAPWQALPYERQLETKHAQVDDALRRIGRLDGFELPPRIVPAERCGDTATSSNTRSGPTPTGASCVASTRPAAGRRSSRSPTACWPRRLGMRPGNGWSRGVGRRG